MEIAQVIISAAVTILALGLLLVTLVSYKKNNNIKLIFVSCMFFIFLIKGILLSLNLLNIFSLTFLSSRSIGWFDVIVLFLLYITTLKR